MKALLCLRSGLRLHPDNGLGKGLHVVHVATDQNLASVDNAYKRRLVSKSKSDSSERLHSAAPLVRPRHRDDAKCGRTQNAVPSCRRAESSLARQLGTFFVSLLSCSTARSLLAVSCKCITNHHHPLASPGHTLLINPVSDQLRACNKGVG